MLHCRKYETINVSIAVHLHLAPRSRIRGTIPLHSLCVFVACMGQLYIE
jgi:hypothetical protein